MAKCTYCGEGAGWFRSQHKECAAAHKLAIDGIATAVRNGLVNGIDATAIRPEEAIKLGNTYIVEKVIGKTSLEDCRHIALATIHKVDVLASWNFKHIVNLDRIKGYNSVNLKLGYSMIEIRSPKDLINYGNN